MLNEKRRVFDGKVKERVKIIHRRYADGLREEEWY